MTKDVQKNREKTSIVSRFLSALFFFLQNARWVLKMTFGRIFISDDVFFSENIHDAVYVHTHRVFSQWMKTSSHLAYDDEEHLKRKSSDHSWGDYKLCIRRFSFQFVDQFHVEWAHITNEKKVSLSFFCC